MITKRDLTDRTIKALKAAPKGEPHIQPDAEVAGFGVASPTPGTRALCS